MALLYALIINCWRAEAGSFSFHNMNIAQNNSKDPDFSLAILSISTSLVAQMVKRLSTARETWVRSLGREDSVEKEMAIHSSTLA